MATKKSNIGPVLGNVLQQPHERSCEQRDQPAKKDDSTRHRKRPSRIPPEVFYQKTTNDSQDSAWSKRLKSIRRRVDEISKLPPLPQIVPEDLRKRRAIWKEFYRQDDAFEFTKSVRSGVHIFSYEVPGAEGGKRRFIGANYSTFWEKYKNMPSAKRHFYEVIPEWSPCKLYFDLEYRRTGKEEQPNVSNTQRISVEEQSYSVEDDLLVENVIATVQKTLQHPPFRANCDRKAVVDLDSR